MPCSIGDRGFYNPTYGTATLHVPTCSLSAYQTAEDWKDFKNIVEYDVTAIKNVNGATDDAKVKAIYTLDGKLVETARRGNAYIIRYEDGSTSKVIR